MCVVSSQYVILRQVHAEIHAVQGKEPFYIQISQKIYGDSPPLDKVRQTHFLYLSPLIQQPWTSYEMNRRFWKVEGRGGLARAPQPREQHEVRSLSCCLASQTRCWGVRTRSVSSHRRQLGTSPHVLAQEVRLEVGGIARPPPSQPGGGRGVGLEK